MTISNSTKPSLRGTFFEDLATEKFEDVQVRSTNFGRAENIKIRDLLKMTPDEEVQRVMDDNAAVQRLTKKWHDEPGFYGELCNPISIFYREGKNGKRETKITNGQHTASMLVGLAHIDYLSYDQEVPVTIYKGKDSDFLDPVIAAKKFVSDNGASIKVLKGEDSFPGEVKYGLQSAVDLMKILDKAKLRFKNLGGEMKDTWLKSNNDVKCLAKHDEIVKRSEIERCIKSDTSTGKTNFFLALDLIRNNYKAKNGIRSSLLISALTYLFTKFEYLNEKPEPYTSFVNWFNSQCKATTPDEDGKHSYMLRPTESSWTGDSIDGQVARSRSIGYKIVKEFLIDPNNGLNKEDLIILSGEFLRKIERSFDGERHSEWVDRQTSSVKKAIEVASK